jgi:hypothetical protein
MATAQDRPAEAPGDHAGTVTAPENTTMSLPLVLTVARALNLPPWYEGRHRKPARA